MRTEVPAIRKAALELLLLEDVAVVRDLLTGILVVVDQAVTHAIGLVKPDRCRVVADVPEGIDLLVLIVRHNTDTAVKPRLRHLLLEVRPFQRSVERLVRH